MQEKDPKDRDLMQEKDQKDQGPMQEKDQADQDQTVGRDLKDQVLMQEKDQTVARDLKDQDLMQEKDQTVAKDLKDQDLMQEKDQTVARDLKDQDQMLVRDRHQMLEQDQDLNHRNLKYVLKALAKMAVYLSLKSTPTSAIAQLDLAVLIVGSRGRWWIVPLAPVLTAVYACKMEENQPADAHLDLTDYFVNIISMIAPLGPVRMMDSA